MRPAFCPTSSLCLWALAQVVDGVVDWQRRDLVVRRPDLPLPGHRLDAIRLLRGQIFELRAIAPHVVEVPGAVAKRREFVSALAHVARALMLEIQRAFGH